MRDYEALWEISREKILKVLSTDLDVGLTFVNLAQSARPSSDMRNRNLHNAREVYNTAVHWLGRLKPESEEGEQIKHKLSELRQVLEQLGEKF